MEKAFFNQALLNCPEMPNSWFEEWVSEQVESNIGPHPLKDADDQWKNWVNQFRYEGFLLDEDRAAVGSGYDQLLEDVQAVIDYEYSLRSEKSNLRTSASAKLQAEVEWRVAFAELLTQKAKL